jgi:hypothetical protein
MTDPYNNNKPRPRPGSGRSAKSATETPPATARSRKAAAPDFPSGRIVHDARGNAMWEWVGGLDTERSGIGSTSTLLKKLEVPDLTVEEDPEENSGLRLVDKGGGYDPYGTRLGSGQPPKPPLEKK